MPTFSNKDVKNALTRYEGRYAPRFTTFQILAKNDEDVVQNSTRIWKTIFNSVDLSNKEEEEVKEKEEEEKDEKEEEQNEEESEEPSIEAYVQTIEETLLEVQTIEESNAEHIIVAVIASLSHSP